MTDLSVSDVQRRTITAFFETRPAADKAVDDVVALGIPRQHVSVVGDNAATSTGTADTADRGFWDSLKDLFLPDEDRSLYAEGLRRGGYLVSVRTEEANFTRVLDVLDRDGAIDLDEREASWRSEGWTGYTADAATSRADTTALTAATAPRVPEIGAASLRTESRATSAASTATTGTLATGKDEVIPVYEEQISVGKRDVNQGRVRVRSYVVETPVTEQVSLRSENVQIERKAVDRAVSGNDLVFQDRVIEAEEHAEQAVVAKQTRVKEEITLRKTAEQHTQTVADTVRHTEVEVMDERKAGATTGQAFSLADTGRIVEHMDVIGSDGLKIGTVDHLDGPDNIKLAKNTSPDGQHHYIPLTWIDHVDAHVHLKRTSVEAKAGW